WDLYFPALKFHFENPLRVGLMVVVILQQIESPGLRHLGADHRDIVPGVAAERLGRLLQPRIIDETAVIDRGIRTERNLDRIRICRRRRRHASYPGCKLPY